MAKIRTLLHNQGCRLDFESVWAQHQKSGWARPYGSLYFHQKVGGPGPTRPIPYLQPCLGKKKDDNFLNDTDRQRPISTGRALQRWCELQS